jgi:2-polyprenyl-3-methyl-5-hydroxy-6-metoxy-1,4-benzoquinol methylase
MKTKLDEHVGAYERKSIYDFDNLLQLEWYPRRIVDLYPDANSLMELGLGHGVTTNAFHPHFKRHLVVDASPAVIENFKKLYPDCKPEITCSLFEEFDSAERFDLIVFGYVLEHVDDPVVVMRHFKKFLSEKGRMFITVPNASVLNRRLGNLAGMLPNITQMSDHDLLLGHKRYYTLETLTKDIEEAGLKVLRMEGIYLKPFTTKQMMSLELGQEVMNALCQVGIDYPELSCSLLAEVA